MSSYGPPGVRSAHPSLPPRPPPSTVAASASTYSSTVSAPPSAGPPASAYGPSAPPSASTYYGPSAGPQQPQQPRLGYSRTFASSVNSGGGGGGGGRGGYNNYNAYTQQQPSSYGPQSGPTTYGAQYGASAVAASAPPQIRNPFPPPNPNGTTYEQEQQMAAQMATWQGAYMPKENSYGGGNGGGGSVSNNTGAAAGYNSYYGPSAPAVTAAATTYGPDVPTAVAGAASTTAGGSADAHGAAGTQERNKTVYRSGGGKTWADDTLLEWDPSHLRLFVGNLAGEVTDDTLLKAFSRWKSVQKALVKRDKWTKKSRGYGFVSFSDPDDFFQAAKEMNGKYIGSHPVVVRKSKTEIKLASVKEDGRKGGKKHNDKQHDKGNKNKGAGNGGGNGGSGGGDHGRRAPYEPGLGPVSSGVHKSGQKTKGGLKLLG